MYQVERWFGLYPARIDGQAGRRRNKTRLWRAYNKYCIISMCPLPVPPLTVGCTSLSMLLDLALGPLTLKMVNCAPCSHKNFVDIFDIICFFFVRYVILVYLELRLYVDLWLALVAFKNRSDGSFTLTVIFTSPVRIPLWDVVAGPSDETV
jgi:hypothetical protein